MTSFMKEFEHLKIQLDEIKRATNSFCNKAIGAGGFGPVYEGEVSHYKGRTVVAIKRLNRQFGQGDSEFLKEIMFLSRYTHQNLISLLGFCDEENEKVLVYEFASKGSLDRHLRDPDLTWVDRIKICIGAAKGLSYLHDPKGKHQRVIHCDIKSANILLDESLSAKVADFGLSKMGPANQGYSVLVTNALGTVGYCDPLFMTTYTLTKESDVYSFGVVLLEVLCGRLCYEYSNGQVKVFVNMWKTKFLENKLNEIVFQDLETRMDPTSLELFSDIAFQCLHDSREGRPTMSIVVEKLEKALESQVLYDQIQNPLRMYKEILNSEVYKEILNSEVYKEILNAAEPPLMFTSIDDLNELLSNGVFLNARKTWFSRNDKGVHYVFKSIQECLIQKAGERYDYTTTMYKSRFPVGSYNAYWREFKARVNTEFLSPLVTYAVNLVFKFRDANMDNVKQGLIWLAYKLDGETRNQVSHFAYQREDGWWTVEVYHFTSDGTTVDLEIIFRGGLEMVIVDGIEFQPLDKEELQVLEDDHKHVVSDSEDDTYWENKLPADYKDIIKFSKQGLQWTTKKELYRILSKGLLVNDKPTFSFFQWPVNHGQQWFCLDKNDKRCLMLPARAVCRLKTPNERKWLHKWMSLPESRFGEGLVTSSSDICTCILIKENKLRVLSHQTKYACYLVYKTERGECMSLVMVQHKDLGSSEWEYGSYIYLVCPQTQVIRPKAGENTHNPLHRPKLKGLPRQRSDGWMEVQIWEFQTETTMTVIPSLSLEHFNQLYEYRGYLNGLIIIGIEFRPI